MPPINLLIKPASGNCNLRCEYCFYYDTMSKRQTPSYGMMSEATLEQVIKKALEYAEGSCAFAYQGGEPTLCGLEFFKQALKFQEQYNTSGVTISNAIQTNGYRITREWADFFVENHFLVGLSIDGLPDTHNQYRRNPAGEGSFSPILETAKLFQRRKVDFNILTVVNGITAPKIERIYRFYQKNGFHYLQFIACLDPLGEEPGQKEYSLTPKAYGTFLMQLFDLWYADLTQGKQPYIRHFENYIGMLAGYPPEACDQRGTCGIQYVVEADGAVYPCDFYVLDAYRLGNLNETDMVFLDQKRSEIGYLEASLVVPDTCKQCHYYAICRNGCRRNRMDSAEQRNYFCESYQMFFAHALQRMEEIAKQI